MANLHNLYYFLYLPPDAAARAFQLCRGLRGGRAPMPEDRLHVTLQFLGHFSNRIPTEVLDLARAVGGAMGGEPFDVAFDLLGSRGGSDVDATLALSGSSLSLGKLKIFQRVLGNTMRRLGFAEEAIRTRFSPHVTLDYQHERVAQQRITPVAWKVTHFFLVDSHYGHGRHEVLACWPLIARQQTLGDW